MSINSASGQEKKAPLWDRSFENPNMLCMIPELSGGSLESAQEVGNFSEQNQQQDDIITMFQDGDNIQRDSPRVFYTIHTVLKTTSVANECLTIKWSG